MGFGAGGTTDVIARYHGQKMSEVLNTPVIIENKPGAGQLPAIQSLMVSAADGYTLGEITGSALSQGPALRKDLPYDPFKDFTYIGLVAVAPGVIVIGRDLPVRTIKELVNYSIANPDKLNYGSSGVGAASHLQIEYLANLTGLKATHIPFKGDSDIMRELMAGSIHLGMSSIQGAMATIAGGKVRAIAVTSSRRQKSLPDIPSLSEVDFKGLEGIDPYAFYGLVGPAGMSAAGVSTINAAINKVSKMPEVSTYMQEKLFAEAGSGTPASFRNYVEKDLAKWKGLAKVIKLPETF